MKLWELNPVEGNLTESKFDGKLNFRIYPKRKLH